MRFVATIIGLSLIAAPSLALGQGVTRSIPSDGGWQLTTVPDGGGCFARIAGHEVDTIVAVNNRGQMALSAGHPDWNMPTGGKQVALRIDGGPAHPFEASPVGNFFMVLVTDDALARQIGAAHRLTWVLPSGPLSANVAGLGLAFNAVRACTHATTPVGGA